MRHRTAADGIRRRMVGLNRAPFERLEAAFYEFVAASAVKSIVAPVLDGDLRDAPAGTVLDVGCGSGAITAELSSSRRHVMGAEPSLPQLERLHRRHSVAFEGLAECARVLTRGGMLVIVEIDGGRNDHELVRFASHTRIPPGLRRLYPALARRTFVPLSPTVEEVSAHCSAVGLSNVRGRRIDGLPFIVVAATR